MSRTEFLSQLDAAVREHYLLDHPFYQSWNAGTLSTEALREYAKQYYQHVAAFPTYLSAAHSRSSDITMRQMLLENLIEEERGENNHPELWMRFAESLGLRRDEVKNATTLPETQALIDTMREVTSTQKTHVALAGLYGYESQIPEVSTTKIDGLKKFYNISDDRAISFFRVHEEADVLHRTVEREAIADHTPAGEEAAVIDAARKSSEALWNMLSGVYNRYCTMN